MKEIMYENFNTGLSKEYLEYLGITNVSEDGRVFTGDTERVCNETGSAGYLRVNFYMEGKVRTLYLHRIVYCWFHGYIPPKTLVDHVSGDRLDNRIENLRLADYKLNTNNRHHRDGTFEMRCCMSKPREHYEAQLQRAEAKPKSKSRATMISSAKARLRYWDSHKDEYLHLTSVKFAAAEAKAEARIKAKTLAELKLRLKFIARKYKEQGDKVSWHRLLRVANNAELFTLEKLQQIADKESKNI